MLVDYPRNKKFEVKNTLNIMSCDNWVKYLGNKKIRPKQKVINKKKYNAGTNLLNLFSINLENLKSFFCSNSSKIKFEIT